MPLPTAVPPGPLGLAAKITFTYFGQRLTRAPNGVKVKHGGYSAGRVGHRRATISHVSCFPSSNRTCGFPRIRLSDHLRPVACAASQPRLVAWPLGIASVAVCGPVGSRGRFAPGLTGPGLSLPSPRTRLENQVRVGIGPARYTLLNQP